MAVSVSTDAVAAALSDSQSQIVVRSSKVKVGPSQIAVAK